MDFDAYLRLSGRTRANDLDSNTALAVAALGLTGEAGEVADLVKKHIGHAHDLDVIKVREELGDLLWYVAWVCELTGLSMADVANENLKKLHKRYPEGFSPERSKNREALP